MSRVATVELTRPGRNGVPQFLVVNQVDYANDIAGYQKAGWRSTGNTTPGDATGKELALIAAETIENRRRLIEPAEQHWRGDHERARQARSSGRNIVSSPQEAAPDARSRETIDFP